MEIVIDDYGTFVGKEGNRFKIESGKGKEEMSADNVTQIIISCRSRIFGLRNATKIVNII